MARRQTAFQRAAVVGVLALAGLLALSYTDAKKDLAKQRAACLTATRELKKAQEEAAPVQKIEDQLTKLTGDLNELQPAQMRRYVALELLKTISEGADPEIILTSFQMRPGQPVQIRGTAPDEGAAADLQAVLLRSDLVAHASLDRVDVPLGPGSSSARRALPPLGRGATQKGKAPVVERQAASGPRVSFMMSVQFRVAKAPRVHRRPVSGGGQ